MIVYCLGMEASGSTWLYNVVRELFSLAQLKYEAFRVEEFEQIADDRAHRAKHVIMRAHNVNSYLLRFLEAADVKTIVSFRDPRDAVASCIQRFGEFGGKLIPTCNDITRNIASAASARLSTRNQSFFYEDKFTFDPKTILQCADFLGIKISQDDAANIFQKYEPQKVKKIIESLEQSGDERLFIDEVTKNVMDRETSFHKTHISDMKIDKWRDVLDVESQQKVARLFGGYVEAINDRRIGLDSATNRPLTVNFRSELFAPVDDMLHFTRHLTSPEVRTQLGIKVLDNVYLPRGRWRFDFGTDGVAGATVLKACQNGQKIYEAERENDRHEFEYLNVLHDHAFDFHLAFKEMEDDLQAGKPPRTAAVSATLVENA